MSDVISVVPEAAILCDQVNLRREFLSCVWSVLVGWGSFSCALLCLRPAP